LEDTVTEKEIRLDEVGLLQKHMEDFGIGAADVNGPQRRFVKRRRAEIPTVEDTGFSETKVRLEELSALEAHMHSARIGHDNPEHPLRLYLKARRAELAPAEEVKAEQPGKPWKRPDNWQKKNKKKW
jgi:hypothetical protein